jgi:hypothetical protein
MKSWWLRHAFQKRATPEDSRSFIIRLLTSIRPVVSITRKGLSFIGIRGGTTF